MHSTIAVGDLAPVAPAMFWLLAVVTAAASLAVAFSRDIVRTAVWLLLALLGVAGIYLLLDAQFLAAVQLVVYAGGILVLIVFGVMLTNRTPMGRLQPSRVAVVGATCVGGVLLATACSAVEILANHRTSAPAGSGPEGTVAELGRLLLGEYLIPFELASVILLVVMIGAAYLAKARRTRRGRLGGGA
jgi:NADH-quinone oxidoreductase subunit J